MKPINFFTTEEEKKIVEAIAKAEKNTSGEIKVHIDSKSKKEPLERAKKVFEKLNMQNTKDRNGVLFHICIKQRNFSIIGDKGIHEKVSQQFWDEIRNEVITKFQQGIFAEALIDAILKSGEKLKLYFPYQTDDKNEISNEISKD